MNSWLKDSVIYQVYPLTFCDSNGDGIGDLKGIESKLDYIKDLGVDVVWLNPFYPSPFTDGGYDVTDFYGVDPRFGTLDDFNDLVKACKKRGLKIVLDMIPGHTSWEHPWFKKSAEFEKNEYSDRFIWTDDIFKKYVDKSIHGIFDRNGGYVVNYYATQPALNYGFNRLPKNTGVASDGYGGGEDGWKMYYTDERLKPLREEIIKILRFWLARGVDGFRMDCANSLVKECVYNSDKTEDIEGLIWIWDQIFTPIRKEYPSVAFIAEWIYPKNAVGKAGFDLDFFAHDIVHYNELFRNEPNTNLTPYFERGHNYFSEAGKGSIKECLKYCDELYKVCDGKGVFSIPTGSHDQVRLAQGMTENELKASLAFIFTFKNVPTLYYGDEIGMTHRFSINREGGYIRTGARTPMQWTNGKNRGFSESDGELYLPVNDLAAQSVETQEQDGGSPLNLVKNLIALRKAHACLRFGGGLNVISDGYPLIFERFDENERLLICINVKKDEYLVTEAFEEVIFAEGYDETTGALSCGGVLIVKR